MENETVSENTPEDAGSLLSSSVPNDSTTEVNKTGGNDPNSGCGEPATTSSIAGSSVDAQNNSVGGSDSKSAKDKDRERDKINILLKPVGDAPILKNKLWAVPAERLVSQITEFVKKYLKLEKNQNLFFFVNQLFAPAPDQCLRDLYECFGSDGKLVLHYSTTVAWG